MARSSSSRPARLLQAGLAQLGVEASRSARCRAAGCRAAPRPAEPAAAARRAGPAPDGRRVGLRRSRPGTSSSSRHDPPPRRSTPTRCRRRARRAAHRGHAAGSARASDLDQQPRLADPRLAGDPHHPAGAGRGGPSSAACSRAELLVPAHQRRSRRRTRARADGRAAEPPAVGRALPLRSSSSTSPNSKSGPAARRTSSETMTPPAGALPISRAARLTGVAQAAEGPPATVAVGAAAQPAGRDADADVGDRRRPAARAARARPRRPGPRRPRGPRGLPKTA